MKGCAKPMRRGRWIEAGAVAGLIALAAFAPPPRVGVAFGPERVRIFTPDGQDPLQHVTRVGTFAPVGLVTVRRSAAGATRLNVGTAFLVSPCHVQTAGHTVPDADQTEASVPPQLRFHTGYSFWRGFAHRDIEGEVVRRGDHRRLGRAGDWAIIRLKECVGEAPEIGWMVPHASTAEREIGGIAGTFSDHATDAVRHLFYQSRCELRQRRVGLWVNDCAARPGASGAPIFRQGLDGAPVVLAMQVAIQARALESAGTLTPQADWTPQTGNVAVDQRTILADPWVAEALAADVARFGRPNPQNLIARERQGAGRS